MDDWDRNNLSWIFFLLLCFNWVLVAYDVCLSVQVDKNERRLEQLEQIHHEQVEENTITCPRCFKEFDINDQAPEYKKPRQRTPAPCGTIR